VASRHGLGFLFSNGECAIQRVEIVFLSICAAELGPELRAKLAPQPGGQEDLVFGLEREFGRATFISSKSPRWNYHRKWSRPMSRLDQSTQRHFEGGVSLHLRTAALSVLLLIAPHRVFFAQTHSEPAFAQDAAQAKADGDTKKAIGLYEEALARSPTWTEGWWRYGGLLYQAHQFSAAEKAFGRLTVLAPENSLGFALLGLCEFEESDWNNSTLHLNKALNRGTLPPEIAHSAAYSLGLSLMHLQNRDGALLTFKLLMHQAPDYPNLSLAMGAAELGLNTVPSPGDAVMPAVQLAGESARYVVEGRPRDAEKSYRELVTQFPTQPLAHLCFGLFLESEHRDDEAQNEFQAETMVSSGNALPWIWIARVALVQQDPKTARSALAHVREIDPNNPLAFLIEGRSFMLEHQWEQALVPLREAEKRVPQSSEVHFALASTYSALHRADAAKIERQLFLQASRTDAPGEGSVNQ
jgi:tetratricopeptide (TPR) repeat protein